MTSSSRPNTAPRLIRWLGLLLGLGALLFCLALSVALGAANISVGTVFDALFRFDAASFEHLVIRTVRLPRVLAGALVGAALAVAGGVMQGLTRNPLADPGILGVEAGASLAVVLAVSTLGSPPQSYAPFAALGAALAAASVYALGSVGRGGATPLKLTLAGAVSAAFLGSFTAALLITDQDTLAQVRFWTAGSLAGRDLTLLVQVAPYIFVGLAGALLLGRQITTLSFGDDVAAGLGQNTGVVKLLAAATAVLLAGGAVALAGPVGFVGLIVPHLVRFVVGADYRWVLPYAAFSGAVLVTLADIGARLALRPQELPVGVVMALVGAPFFIYLARTKPRCGASDPATGPACPDPYRDLYTGTDSRSD